MCFRHATITAAIVAGIVSGVAAQAPKKIGEVYATKVLAVTAQEAGGAPIETFVPARLTVLSPDPESLPTTATLEVDVPATAVLVRVPVASLPAEHEAIFKGRTDRLFVPRAGGMNYGRRSPELFELAENPDGTGEGIQHSFDATVLDGTGKPAAGMEVEVWTSLSMGTGGKALIASAILGSDGRIMFSLPEAGRDPLNPFEARGGAPMSLGISEIVVTDPSSRQKQTLSVHSLLSRGPLTPGEERKPVTEIGLALVPAGADGPAFRGRVLDAEGGPAAGAQFGYHWLATPGMGGKQFFGEAGTITAGDGGSFSLGVPVTFLEAAFGHRLLPDHSVLTVQVNGIVDAKLSPGGENLIELPHTEDLTFELRDENNQPLKEMTRFIRERGGFRLIRVDATTGSRAGNPALSLGEVIEESRARVRAPQVPLPGTYRLEQAVGGQRFEDQRLERGASAGVVVWKAGSERPTVVGRVVAAETGAPIEGAFILGANEQSAAWSLIQMEPARREEVFSKWMAGKKDEVVKDDRIDAGGGHTIYRPEALTRTDADGRFRLEFPAGKQADGVSVCVPGRMGASSNMHEMRTRPDLTRGVIEVADLALPLSAEVTVTVLAPPLIPDPFLKDHSGTRPAVSHGISTGAGFDRPGPWKAPVPGLNPEGNSPWRLVDGATWSNFGQPYVVHTPAGVKVSITGSCPYSPTLGHASWRDVGPLSPGERVTLEAKEISVKRPFLIAVKKSDGQPAVGVGVRLDGELPLTTDEQGTAIGWTTGYVGRLEVMPDQGWEAVASKRGFEVPQNNGQDPFRVELTIP